MPVAVDHPAVREQVRLLYLGNGGNLTLAAKTAGIPVDRAEKWKERGKWDQADDPAAKQLKSLSEAVGKTADRQAAEIAENSHQTRSSLGKAVLKASKTFEKMPGEEIIDKSQELKAVTGAGSQVFGWEERKAADAGLVSVTLVRVELSETRGALAGGDAADRAKVVPCHELPE